MEARDSFNFDENPDIERPMPKLIPITQQDLINFGVLKTCHSPRESGSHDLSSTPRPYSAHYPYRNEQLETVTAVEPGCTSHGKPNNPTHSGDSGNSQYKHPVDLSSSQRVLDLRKSTDQHFLGIPLDREYTRSYGRDTLDGNSHVRENTVRDHHSINQRRHYNTVSENSQETTESLLSGNHGVQPTVATSTCTDRYTTNPSINVQQYTEDQLERWNKQIEEMMKVKHIQDSLMAKDVTRHTGVPRAIPGHISNSHTAHPYSNRYYPNAKSPVYKDTQKVYRRNSVWDNGHSPVSHQKRSDYEWKCASDDGSVYIAEWKSPFRQRKERNEHQFSGKYPNIQQTLLGYDYFRASSGFQRTQGFHCANRSQIVPRNYRQQLN